MRIVLDTNVVVSGFLWNGVPRRLIEAIIDGRVEATTSLPLLEELLDVAGRPHLAMKMAEHQLTPALLVERYRAITELVTPAEIGRVIINDPDDDVLIATAVAARADLIVSGDRNVLAVGEHRGVDIVTPAQAVTRIDSIER